MPKQMTRNNVEQIESPEIEGHDHVAQVVTDQHLSQRRHYPGRHECSSQSKVSGLWVGTAGNGDNVANKQWTRLNNERKLYLRTDKLVAFWLRLFGKSIRLRI